MNTYQGKDKALVATSLVLTSLLTACGSGMSPAALTATETANCLGTASEVTATEVRNCITAAQWAAAEADPHILELDNVTGTGWYYEMGAKEVEYTDSNGVTRDRYEFEVGKPYVLKVVNKKTTSSGSAANEHYISDYIANGGYWGRKDSVTAGGPFVPQSTTEVTTGNKALTLTTGGALTSSQDYIQGVRWADNGFWRSIVLEKVVTRQGQYRAPYLLDFELNDPKNNGGGGTSGQGNDTVAWIYFVPVVAGDFQVYCNKSYHETMLTTFKITGDFGHDVDFEVPSTYDATLLQARERHNNDYKAGVGGSTITNPWDSTNFASTNSTKRFEMLVEEASGVVDMTDKTLTSGNAYQFRLSKKSGSTGEYTIKPESFLQKMVIRKIQDVDAQIKPVYMTEITLLDGAGDECAPVQSGAAGTCISNTNGTANSTHNGNNNPGDRSVDMYVYAPASSVGSYTVDFSKTSSGVTTDSTATATITVQ